MPTKHRIFWSGQEKGAVLTTARDLRERQPQLTLAQIGSKAQAPLPKHRRRPVNNKLTSWLSTELKGRALESAPTSRTKAIKRRGGSAVISSPAPSNLIQSVIEQGAAILSGILRHPSVRDALSTVSRGRVSRKR